MGAGSQDDACYASFGTQCVNYETVSYVICGFLTTAVDFVSYGIFRRAGMGVGASQALSWLAAVLFAYVVNKWIVFRNYDLRPSM